MKLMYLSLKKHFRYWYSHISVEELSSNKELAQAIRDVEVAMRIFERRYY